MTPCNWQMEHMQNLINSAKSGSVDAIDFLRNICTRAAMNAPPDDLIQIAEFLYEMRHEAARKHAEASMPRGEVLRKLPPSLPPTEWWEEDDLF